MVEFSTVYSKYHNKVTRHVSELLHNNDIDDVVQEIFLKIEKALPGFKGESKLSTWIHRITINHCIDIQRKLKRKLLIQQYEQESFDLKNNDKDSGNVESNYIKTEMDKCIKSYIKQLPEIYREVVLLGDIKGYSNKEMVQKLGLTLETVKMRLHRGRHRLKNLLTKQCCLYYNENNELACEQI